MIFFRVPMRVSFLGGGSDLPAFYRHENGFVVSAAIKKYIYITVNTPFDNIVKLHYSKDEIVKNTKDLKHDLARSILTLYDVQNHIEISSISDLPASGTGMGSSSSYCVGLLAALRSYLNLQPYDKLDLAEEACKIELQELQKPIGKQDQYIAAYGGMRSFEFLSNETVKIGQYENQNDFMKDLESNLVLLYTGVTRSADPILTEQSKNTTESKSTRNIIGEVVSLAKQLDMQFKSHRFDELAALLHESWKLKKLYAPSITNPILEDLYNKAIQFGAQGGKLLGAGGGGFFLLVADPDVQNYLKLKMPENKFIPISFDFQGSTLLHKSN